MADDIIAQSNYQSLARLLPLVEKKYFSAGEVIYEAGANADIFYILLEGAVNLVSPQGRAVPLHTERFGEESASDSKQYMFGAIATEDVTVLAIPRFGMRRLIAANPHLKTAFLLSLTGSLAGEKLASIPLVTEPKIKTISVSGIWGWVLTILFPIAVLVLGEHFDLARSSVIFGAIFSATVVMWVFSLVDDYIPALFALLATLLTGLVPAPVILSGFASDGFLMALSTLALGTVVVTSGLSYRFMLMLLYRLPNTQFWHNVGLFLTGFILTPIIPTANGRITLVSPFFADMVDSLRLTWRGLAATRLAVTCFGGVSLFSAIFITSKSVNFAVFGLLSPQGQDHFQWVTWFLTAIVTGAVLLAFSAVVAMVLFRNNELPQLPKKRVAEQLKLLGKMSNREWAAILGVGFMMLGIITSSIHKVSPPWLGFSMLFGLLLCGVLNKKELKEKVDWTFLLYLSGITGIVAVFSYLGLDKELGEAMPVVGAYMRTDFNTFVLLIFILINIVRLAVPINATIVILATIFMPLAEINGINPWVVGFIILVFAECWFLPYQCSYYLQLQELNRVKPVYDERSFLVFNTIINFARLAAIYASIPYWKMLGLL